MAEIHYCLVMLHSFQYIQQFDYLRKLNQNGKSYVTFYIVMLYVDISIYPSLLPILIQHYSTALISLF